VAFLLYKGASLDATNLYNGTPESEAKTEEVRNVFRWYREGNVEVRKEREGEGGKRERVRNREGRGRRREKQKRKKSGMYSDGTERGMWR
jgi:hypothetical protein